jgi:hypothetical protein
MIQFKCMQLSKVKKERIYDQHGQGTLALIPCYLLLKVFFLKVLMISEVHSVKIITTENKQYKE